ncbi:MAG: hypothetical protein WBA25_09310 [Jannaschia sp.]
MADPSTDTGFWRPPPEECSALLRHLLLDVPPGHVLWMRRDALEVEARALDRDQVIVLTGDPALPVARVRMTWRGRPEIAPFLPETDLYPSREALRRALLEGSEP